MIIKWFKQKDTFIKGKSRTFVHYWTNDQENFPDTNNIEDYLSTNYPDYEWVEASLKIERPSIKMASIVFSTTDADIVKDIFLKVEESQGVPFYYNSVSVQEPSTQNYSVDSYTINCELDHWSTFGLTLFNFLKFFPDDVYIIRKMCDRFLYNPEKNKRYLDYNTQTYLKQYGNWNYPLFKNNNETSLTLEKWANLHDTQSTWPAETDPFYSFVSVGAAATANVKGYDKTFYQNSEALSFNRDKDVFLDEYYNAGGMYRYFSIKTGTTSDVAGSKVGDLQVGPIFPKVTGSWAIQGNGGLVNLRLHSESLAIFPVKKDSFNFSIGTDIAFNETIHALFQMNSEDVVIGSQSIIGALVSDIPPIILASAIKYRDTKKEIQTLSSYITMHEKEHPVDDPNPEKYKAPFYASVVKVNKDLKTSSFVPVIWTDLSYIPIVIARTPEESKYDLLHSEFLSKFDMMLSNDNILVENTIEWEPFMYSPAFYQWTYKTDGASQVSISADMIDWLTFSTKKWEINLNVFFGERSYFKVDLSTLKSTNYPFTKTFAELSTTDNRMFPFTTAQYTNWLQNNETTLQASKNALDYQIKYGSASNSLNAVGSGLSTAGMTGSAGLGIISGLMGIGGTIAGISRAKKEWQNQWDSTMGNMYTSPSTLNTSGFGSGSINFSTTANSDNNYQLFKTYQIPDYAREEIWNEIAMNGYYFKSMCKFKDYDNRTMFNYIRADLSNKWFRIYNFLKEQMEPISFLFSQAEWALWLNDKLNSGMRLFKIIYDNKRIDNFIKYNIEVNAPWFPTSLHIEPVAQLPRIEVGKEFASKELITKSDKGGIINNVVYSIEKGTLPAGLTLNGSTGVISGIPESPYPNLSTVIITANSLAFSSLPITNATITFAIDYNDTIVISPSLSNQIINFNESITPTPLLSAVDKTTGEVLLPQYYALYDNIQTSQILRGLPDDLTIDSSTGIISGKPTLLGEYIIVIYATLNDSGVLRYSNPLSFKLKVNPIKPMPNEVILDIKPYSQEIPAINCYWTVEPSTRKEVSSTQGWIYNKSSKNILWTPKDGSIEIGEFKLSDFGVSTVEELLNNYNLMEAGGLQIIEDRTYLANSCPAKYANESSKPSDHKTEWLVSTQAISKLGSIENYSNWRIKKISPDYIRLENDSLWTSQVTSSNIKIAWQGSSIDINDQKVALPVIQKWVSENYPMQVYAHNDYYALARNNNEYFLKTASYYKLPLNYTYDFLFYKKDSTSDVVTIAASSFVKGQFNELVKDTGGYYIANNFGWEDQRYEMTVSLIGGSNARVRSWIQPRGYMVELEKYPFGAGQNGNTTVHCGLGYGQWNDYKTDPGIKFSIKPASQLRFVKKEE